MDQLGLTLAHCTVSLQSSVGYTEVYHINTTDRYERTRDRRVILFMYCCKVYSKAKMRRLKFVWLIFRLSSLDEKLYWCFIKN